MSNKQKHEKMSILEKFENGLTSEGTQKPVLSESGLFYVWEVWTNSEVMDIQYYAQSISDERTIRLTDKEAYKMLGLI